MEWKINFILAILMIILAVGVFGGYNYVSNNLIANYSAGDKIKGFFNISFSDENANSLLTSNFNGSIKLIDFFDANNLVRGSSYTCSTANCENSYSAQDQTTGFSVSGSSAGKLAGFKITGQNVFISSVKFNVSSNVLSSCTNQLFIDVLNDEEDLILNTRHENESCGAEFTGCFNPSTTSQATIMSDREFCERISLPSAPAFYLGATIQNGTSYSPITMKFYDLSGSSLGSCNLPRHSQNIEKLKCVVEYPAFTNNTYYVCLKSGSNSGYKIGWETENPTCGTVLGGSGAGFSSLGNDFDIFAENIKFAGNPVFGVNDASYDNQFNIILTNLFDNYLSDTYGRDCQTFDCVFPIRFFGQSQFFQFTNPELNYDTGGVQQSTNQFYELDVDEPQVSSEELKLDIEKANFRIPIDSTENKFKLFLNDGLVFEKDINVRRGFAFDINTKLVPFGQNTLFRIISSENIVNSTWNFGDNTATQNVQGREINHGYVSTNNSAFDLTVTAVNNRSVSSTRTFRVYVGSPRELANITIEDYKKRVVNLTSRINNYSEWIKTPLSLKIGISDIGARLNVIESDYNLAASESDYQDVMLDLIELNVPKDIRNAREENSLPLSIAFNSINPSYIEVISNKDLQNNNELKNSIVGWMNSRFNPELSYKHITAIYDYEQEVLMSEFKIETKPKNPISDETYLIFGNDVESAGGFKTNYNQKSVSGSGIKYVILNTNNNQVFEFYLDGEIKPTNLGAYISPDVKKLPLVPVIIGECNLNNICDGDEDANSCPEDCSKKVLKFTIWSWIILFILAFVVYILMQEWYKRNYQKHLFRNEEELYNLINFIYNARKSGLHDSDIKYKLESIGWASEKIRFAFRKIDGKRTGMLEIPIFKFLENKKVSNELQKRQPRPVDYRFVRRGIY